MAVNVENGRVAISHFKRIQSFGLHGKHPFASSIEAKLETGRTHQVRVHLTHLGHSLLGDPTYGSPTQNQAKWKSLPPSIQAAIQALSGQALHARILGFSHPISGENLHFEAPLFPAFQTLLDLLQSYTE
jgi:23S rRNA pseudouridine1911/1915/1917 synthase